MRCEVWVTATGQGQVPAAAADAALALLGDEALGCEVTESSWRLGLVVEAEGAQSAGAAAQVQAQAVALLAGLPDWPVTHWSARGEDEERDLGDGFTDVHHEVAAMVTFSGPVFLLDDDDDEDDDG